MPEDTRADFSSKEEAERRPADALRRTPFTFEPDAWERFEAAVDKTVKAPHRGLAGSQKPQEMTIVPIDSEGFCRNPR